MKPIVVACHSGIHGKRWLSTSRRISCQRMVRTGKVRVATTTVRSSSHPLACCAYVQTFLRSILYNTQTSNATLTASPISQAPLQRFLLFGFDGEDNEIADFVDDRAEAFAARALSRLAQLLRALAGTGPLVEERADVDGLSSIRCTLRGSADQHVERRRSDTGRDHLLIPRPRARQIRRG